MKMVGIMKIKYQGGGCVYIYTNYIVDTMWIPIVV
jgi:hypothetical protein